MKIKAKIDFYDRENDMILREKDTCFEADPERADQLIKMGYAEEHKEEETSPEAPAEEKTKRTRKKKAE